MSCLSVIHIYSFQKLEKDVSNLENVNSQLEISIKDVKDVARDEKKKTEDIFNNMKDELKSNMQMNEV